MTPFERVPDQLPAPSAAHYEDKSSRCNSLTPTPGEFAPGAPGIEPTWTTSAKDIVGCGMGPSRIWFTMGFGIVNEVYYPRVDIPQIRDLGFIVADGRGFWVEVKRLENYALKLLAPGTPAVEVVHRHDRFALALRVTSDPDRDVLAIAVELSGDPELRPYVLLAPHLGATGYDNLAEVARFGGHCVLAASQGPFGLALAAADEDQRDALGRASAGYVGASDGWQDFQRHGALTWCYAKAGPGNVALTAALPRRATLAVGFGSSTHAAATLAVTSLMQPFERLVDSQIERWAEWHARRREHSVARFDGDELAEAFLLSAMVLRSHRDKTFPGTMVASLSVPWGNTRNDRAGYHVVWPRDLVQCALSLLALGAARECRNTLRYLIATQNADGSWHQNQWLGGTPYWTGLQLDEIGFPVLLAAALAERGALDDVVVGDMIQRALSFIARTGPSSQQDRWEEAEGLSPFTLAVCIAALVSGAQFLPPAARALALDLADFWNANLENWTSVQGTDLAQRLGVKGYYIRVAPPDVLGGNAMAEVLSIANRNGALRIPADEEVSIDFLQLVRYGLRAAEDPLVADSVRVVDALLKVDTPRGPAWHRYNGDGYGEYDDGRPYDGSGRGRAWPLLAGERGHYELVAGRDPLFLLKAMCAMTGPAGMMPEQVWDTAPLPAQRLLPGRPSGSAMPLAWAHAEFIKLMVSRKLGFPFDRPAALWERYRGRRPDTKRAFYCLHAPVAKIARGQALTIALPEPARIHWGTNGWNDVSDLVTRDSGLGLHVADIDAGMLARANTVDFTVQWRGNGAWIGRDLHVAVTD